MQPQQLRHVTPDRHLPALSALALADGDDALNEADILDTKLHQLGSPGAGFQQRLQHQSGAAVLGVGPVEEAKFFLNSQPIDAAAAMFRGRPQPGSLPCGFENGFALRVIDAFTHEDGGDGGGDTFDRGHDPVCFKVSGVQTWGFGVPMRAKVAGGRRAGSVSSFPLRLLWKARPPAIRSGGPSCA